MKSKNIFWSVGVILTIVLAGLSLNLSKNQSLEGMVIFTRIPIDNFEIQKNNLTSNFIGAQIVASDPNNPEGSEIILTTEFFSACSPNISYDAKRILFTAQQNENDNWQIWEMDLETKTSKKITDFKESCFGPNYLPFNRLVFTKQMPESGIGKIHALHTMNLDGSNFSQITFQPHFDYTATVLKDGRLLMLSKQLFPESGEMVYMAMRPNGTKAELFYKGEIGSILNTQSYETEDGLVYFIESENKAKNGGDIISIHQNRPLFTKENITSEITGSFYSVLPTQSGEMFVSYQASESEPSVLFRFSVKDKSLGELIYSNPEYFIVEPLFVEAFTRPRDLPDDVDPEISTGLLLCQDINVVALQPETSSETVEATKVELLGIDKSLGIVPVEEDGSVYLKVVADTPVRFQTLDENDNVVNGPSGWMWVRPFERRGCVGCHEDPELTPDNFVPFAVKKEPVSIPVENSPETEQSSTNERTEQK